jgi:dihydrofolate reductase
VGADLPAEVGAIKRGEGREILIFGSASAAHALMAHNLIDNFWLFVNPVLLGSGLPLFSGVTERKALKTLASTQLASGVVCLQYRTAQSD